MRTYEEQAEIHRDELTTHARRAVQLIINNPSATDEEKVKQLREVRDRIDGFFDAVIPADEPTEKTTEWEVKYIDLSTLPDEDRMEREKLLYGSFRDKDNDE